MSDSIGKFVLDFEARISNLESDLGRAERLAQKSARALQKSFEDGFKKMEEAAHRGTEGVMDALNSLTGLNPAQLGIGAIVAGLGELTKKAIETGDQLNKMAQRTGISVTALSGIAFAGDLADVALGDLGTSMEKFAKTAAAAANGSKDQAAAFAAIGISVKNADGSIRPLDQLLGSVATKFSGYKDGVEKTALAQALFGKSGAAMIPLLNQGAVGLKKASDEAKALGYNFDGIAQQSEDFNDNLTRMGKAAVGLGADIARELLPSLISGEEKILDFVKSMREDGYLQAFASGIAFVATNLDTLAVIIASRLALGALVSGFELVTSAATASAAAISVVEGVIGLLGGAVGILALVAGATYYLATQENVAEKASDDLAAALEKVKNISSDSLPSMTAMTQASLRAAEADLKRAESVLAVIEANAQLNQQSAEAAAGTEAGQYMQQAANSSSAFVDHMRESIGKLHEEIGKGKFILATENDLLRDMGDQAKKTAPNVSGLGAKVADGANAADAYAASITKAAQMLAKFQGATSPAAKALQDFIKAQIETNAQAADMVAKGAKAGNAAKAFAQAQQFATTATNANVVALEKANAAIAKQADVLGRFLADIGHQDVLLGMSESERAVAEAVQKVTDEYNKNVEAGIVMAKTLDEVTAGAAAGERAFQAHSAAVKASEEVAKEWVGIWKNAGDGVADTFAKILVEGGSLFDGLKNIAKEVVEQIIAQFAKLAIINPILNSIFGQQAGGGSLLPTLGAFFSGGSGSVSGFNAVTGQMDGGGANFTSTAGGATQNSLFSGASWLSAGEKLYTGFEQGGFTGAIKNLFGFGSGAAAASSAAAGGAYAGSMSEALGITDWGAAAGASAEAASTASTAASAMSTFASWLPIIGLIIMGMAQAEKFRHQGWKPNDDGHGLDYSEVGSNPFATLAAPGAFVTTNDYNMLRKLGVNEAISNILTGAAIADRFFGHKKPQLVDGSQTLNFDPKNGASGFLDANIISKGGYFSSDKKWTEHTELTGDDLKAAQDFIDLLNKSTKQFAEQFGVTMAESVGGSFKQEFDKNGNATDKTTSIINGQTYNNETQEQFQQRLIAESDLAVLDTFDAKLDESVASYRSNVDSLMQVVSGLSGIETMLQAGEKFLALGSDQSLSSILKLAEGMQLVGETIDQTLQRIAQAQQQYDSFVGQFKPPTTYVDDFEAALSGVNQQMLANIKQANDLARAAGAEGAATQDLVNIHQLAANQVASLITSLEASAQALAYSMGLTQAGTLDQVNSEIAQLEGASNHASTSLGSFGDTIRQVSQQASDAMNLLLGDLSPLNDQEKLAKALQGLYAGTVSQQQVLEIGRRLYATGQQYTDLFNVVMQHPGANTGAQYGGGGSSGSSDSQGSSDPQRLQDLYKQRDDLLAKQDYQNAQTLGQQIAELMSAKGEDLQQILDELGINSSDLEQRLHLDNFDQLKAFEADKQKQLDGNKENTVSIVGAINRVNDSIIRGLGLQPDPGGHLMHGGDPGTGPSPRPGDDAPPTTGGGDGTLPGHSGGHGGAGNTGGNGSSNADVVTAVREGHALQREFNGQVLRLVLGNAGGGRSLRLPERL